MEGPPYSVELEHRNRNGRVKVRTSAGVESPLLKEKGGGRGGGGPPWSAMVDHYSSLRRRQST